MRRAAAADRPAIVAFLAARAERAMFPLSNLLAHGMEGGHPRAMRFWLLSHPLEGVLGLSEQGMAFPVLAPALAPDAAAAIAGLAVMGFAGEAEAAGALRAAAGLDDAPARMAHVEPHFALDLAALRMPEVAGLALGPLEAAPRATLIDWAVAYAVETLEADPGRAREEAEADVARWVAAGSHRVLWRGGEPVARTGFNARAPGIVQVGGVYVPPALRGQGLGRAAVALHLAEAHAEGATRATLFAANPAAARAYEALGFRPIGRFLLCLLAAPTRAAR